MCSEQSVEVSPFSSIVVVISEMSILSGGFEIRVDLSVAPMLRFLPRKAYTLSSVVFEPLSLLE